MCVFRRLPVDSEKRQKLCNSYNSEGFNVKNVIFANVLISAESSKRWGGDSTYVGLWLPQHKAPLWAYPEDGYADREPFKIILKLFQDEGCVFQDKKYEGIYWGWKTVQLSLWRGKKKNIPKSAGKQ